MNILEGLPTCTCSSVLVVDDNAFNQFAIIQLLKRLNINADKVDSGELAIPHIKQVADRECCKGYKLILMDINMPGINGYEVIYIYIYILS